MCLLVHHRFFWDRCPPKEHREAKYSAALNGLLIRGDLRIPFLFVKFPDVSPEICTHRLFHLTVHVLTLTSVYRYETPSRNSPGVSIGFAQEQWKSCNILFITPLIWAAPILEDLMSDSSPKSLGISNGVHMFQAQIALLEGSSCNFGWVKYVC